MTFNPSRRDMLASAVAVGLGGSLAFAADDKKDKPKEEPKAGKKERPKDKPFDYCMNNSTLSPPSMFSTPDAKRLTLVEKIEHHGRGRL